LTYVPGVPNRRRSSITEVPLLQGFLRIFKEKCFGKNDRTKLDLRTRLLPREDPICWGNPIADFRVYCGTSGLDVHVEHGPTISDKGVEMVDGAIR